MVAWLLALSTVAAPTVCTACAGAARPAAEGRAEIEAAVRSVAGGDRRPVAVLAVDNSTGEIVSKAVVGDAAAAPLDGGARPAASLAKVVVLAAVLESGLPPDHVLRVPQCIWLSQHRACTRSAGEVSVAEAVVFSINPAFVMLTELVGPNVVAEYGSRVGMVLDPTLAIPLGIDPVSMESVAALFLALANDGETLAIRDSSGAPALGAAGRLVSSDTARVMRRLLRSAVMEGTGTAADGPDRPFGKTGTAEGRTDAWFAGSTDAWTIVVWVGTSDKAHEAEPPHGPSRPLTGGGLPAQIFRVVADLLGPRPRPA